MKAIYWIESKQLDRVTNFSSRTEIIRAAIEVDIDLQYYCTYSNKKKHYGLKKNINYLGFANNKYVKYLEFNILVLIKSIELVLFKKNVVIMVNADLVKHMLVALKLNNIFKRNNKFIVDIRTTPTNPNTFNEDIKNLHSKFKYAVKNFHGLSFITPFMEDYIMELYKNKYKSVNWSSGVNVDLFDPKKVKPKKVNKKFNIFYHGGISETRGSLNLIKACERLVDQGYNIELKQVGILVDKSIKKYIDTYHLKNWCKLLDPVPISQIPQMIADADLPVLPFPNFLAWRVSSPIKLMEYLAMGKKVLAPDMESFTNVFGIESEIVFYFNSGSSDPVLAIEKRIKMIIDNKLLNYYEINKPREFVVQEFTWNKQATKLIEFCNSL